MFDLTIQAIQSAGLLLVLGGLVVVRLCVR
jgi:hypothetical protein